MEPRLPNFQSGAQGWKDLICSYKTTLLWQIIYALELYYSVYIYSAILVPGGL